MEVLQLKVWLEDAGMKVWHAKKVVDVKEKIFSLLHEPILRKSINIHLSIL
jgi:hypothetical protein